MKLIDISWPITEDITAYKDNQVVKFTPVKNFSTDKVRDTNIFLNCHTGTHIDAPAHFLEQGKTIDKFSLDQLYGPCRVVDLTHCAENITSADLQSKEFQAGEIILFKTKNSLLGPTAPFDPHFIYLTLEAAEFLAERKIKAVGIDYLGIERSQPNHPTHSLLLHLNIPIIEGLRLKEVQEGHYTLICLPLAIPELEAAPARAILIPLA